MEKKKVICIVGRSGSGKDWIGGKLDLDMVVSYTTRPIRENETNGKEHWFISEEDMDDILLTEDVIAFTKIGDYRYCATLKDLFDTTIYIIDPNGLKYLKENFSDKLNIKSVYIYCDESVRNERVKHRSDYSVAFAKRNEAENEQFTNFENERLWDLIVDNTDGNINISKLKKKILFLFENEN